MSGVKGRSGVYKRTKKHRQIMSKCRKGIEPWNKNLTKETDIRVKEFANKLKGKNPSQKTRLKMSKAKIETIPWNKDKTAKEDKRILSGKNNPMYGVHKFGKDSPHWQGGEIRNSQGYVFINLLNHPFKDYKGYVRRSRLTMEKKLGRYLTKKEVVHHINEIKDDDRIENLMVFINNSAHMRFHHNPKNVKPSEIVFDGRNYW